MKRLIHYFVRRDEYMTQLSNYLRAHRKSSGLSQRDVARLLGGGTGSKVSGYEHFSRTPSLRTALRLQVILKQPVSDLFEGMFKEAETAVADHARRLQAGQHESKNDSPRTCRLSELAKSLTNNEDAPF